MAELLDVYNINKEKTGKVVERKQGTVLDKDEYIISVQCWIINSKGEILLTQRRLDKKDGGKWEPTTGLILSGENSIQGMKRELQEEIGVVISEEELILAKEIIENRDDVNFFRDTYVLKKDIELRDISFNDAEVIDAKYVTLFEFMYMIEKGEAFEWLKYFADLYGEVSSEIHCVEYFEMQYREMKEAEKIKYLEQSKSYLGKEAKAVIDRPLGSKPIKEHPDFVYELNYGFIPNTISGDGEELDCYILGVAESIKEFEGECIAIVHRLNETDDKLILVPKGKEFTLKEIEEAVYFSEKHHKSIVIR